LKTLYWLTIYSIAMAFLESAVVVYLRALYYPDGFGFPLVAIDPSIALTEVIREAATIIMLVGAGIIAGRNASEKFAYFIYCFSIWDIFYYIFLKLLLGWPPSLLTWDILFLIPMTWTGPVITPIILSLTMILLAACIIYFSQKAAKVKIAFSEWLLLIVGSLMVIISFIWDYTRFILQHYSYAEIWSLSLNMQYIPQSFNWWLFGIGELTLLIAIGMFCRKQLKVKMKN